jgi:hypothetical protein
MLPASKGASTGEQQTAAFFRSYYAMIRGHYPALENVGTTDSDNRDAVLVVLTAQATGCNGQVRSR